MSVAPSSARERALLLALQLLLLVPFFDRPVHIDDAIWLQIALLGTLFSGASIPFNMGYGALTGFFSERLRRVGGLMNKISAIVFGGLAARLAIN